MKRILSLMLAAVLALGIVSPALAKTVPGTPTRGDAIGMNISDFVTVDLDNNPVDGSIFHENTLTVVNMWATWCGPCRNELPHFQQLHEVYSATPEDDVMMLGVLLINGSSTVSSGRQLLQQNGYTFYNIVHCSTFIDVLYTTDDQNTGSVSIPQTVIVDRNGVVRDHIVGAFPNYTQLSNLVSDWLEILLEEEANAVIPGDMDNDGSVTIGDAVSIMRMALGLAEGNSNAADVNGNGSVDMADAVMALHMVMGL
ncbi:MAG: redoxin family protein [Clostridia bacterium]|nr:redoxin family protein [Clostridia bacterium]